MAPARHRRCPGGRVYPGRDYANRSRKRFSEWLLRQVPTAYRKESSPVGDADGAMQSVIPSCPRLARRGNHPGFLSHTQRCSGGRVYPGRDYATPSPKCCSEWLLRQVPTVYRKESSPVGEADRAMQSVIPSCPRLARRGNHPGFLSYPLRCLCGVRAQLERLARLVGRG